MNNENVDIKSSKGKNKSSDFDLGKGKVSNTFWKIWVPTIIAQLIAGTFIVFDTIFVSHGYHAGAPGEIGSWASNEYSALGPGGIAYAMPYTLLIISVGLLLGAGMAYKMTKQKANNDQEGLQESIDSFLPTVIIVGAFITLIFFFGAKFFIWMGSGFQPYFLENWFNNPLLQPENRDVAYLMAEVEAGDPNDIAYNAALGQLFNQAAWYLRIQALGAIPYIYMVGGQLILRVEGKATVATKFTGAALLTNIFLDFLFINVFGLNLVGAAMATVTAQTLAAILYYNYYRNKFPIKIQQHNFRAAKRDLTLVSSKGTSSMFQQTMTAFVLWFFTFSIGVINWGDAQVVTGYTSAFQGYFSLFTFFNLIIIGTSQAMMPLTTYNYEIKRYDRVKETWRISFWTVLIFSLFVTAFVVFFPGITKLFGETGLGSLYQQRIAQIMFITFAIGSLILLTGVYFQSIGQDLKMKVLILGKIALLIPLVLILGFTLKEISIVVVQWPWVEYTVNEDASVMLFWALPIAELLMLPILITLIYKHQKNLNSLINEHNLEDIKNNVEVKKVWDKKGHYGSMAAIFITWLFMVLGTIFTVIFIINQAVFATAIFLTVGIFLLWTFFQALGFYKGKSEQKLASYLAIIFAGIIPGIMMLTAKEVYVETNDDVNNDNVNTEENITDDDVLNVDKQNKNDHSEDKNNEKEEVILNSEDNIYTKNELLNNEFNNEKIIEILNLLHKLKDELSEINLQIPISKINGIGPKFLEYFNDNNIYIIFDLLNLNQSNLEKLIKNKMPGFKNEGNFDKKMAKINNFIEKIKIFVEENDKEILSESIIKSSLQNEKKIDELNLT